MPVLLPRKGWMNISNGKFSAGGLAPFIPVPELFFMQPEHYIQFFTATSKGGNYYGSVSPGLNEPPFT